MRRVAGILGIARGRTRIAAEHLVERLVERIGESDLVAERHQHLLEQREAGRSAGLHVHRLHIHQTATQRQCQQVASVDLGGTGFEQVQLLRHVRVRVEVVLRLPRSGNVGVLGQLLQSYRAVVRPDYALFVARVGIHRQEAGEDFSRGRAGGDVRGGQREHRLLRPAGLQ